MFWIVGFLSKVDVLRLWEYGWEIEQYVIVAGCQGPEEPCWWQYIGSYHPEASLIWFSLRVGHQSVSMRIISLTRSPCNLRVPEQYPWSLNAIEENSRINIWTGGSFQRDHSHLSSQYIQKPGYDSSPPYPISSHHVEIMCISYLLCLYNYATFLTNISCNPRDPWIQLFSNEVYIDRKYSVISACKIWVADE